MNFDHHRATNEQMHSIVLDAMKETKGTEGREGGGRQEDRHPSRLDSL